jgi:hypothetical protein
MIVSIRRHHKERYNIMGEDYSKRAFMEFMDYVADKGLVKVETARTWRVAASKLLVDVGDDEDVRPLEVEVLTRKAANRNGDLSPETLNAYRKRVQLARKEFLAWRENPINYKPQSFSRNLRPAQNGERAPKAEKQPQGRQADATPKEKPSVTNGLPLSYPLRPDFLAELIIPRDLKTDEARRLGAFLLTLAADYKPS